VPLDAQIPHVALVAHLLDALDATQRVLASFVFDADRAAALGLLIPLVEVQVVNAPT